MSCEPRVDPLHEIDRLIQRVATGYVRACALAHAHAQLMIQQQLRDHFCKSLGVPGGHYEAGLAIDDHLRKPTHSADYDWHPTGLRFYGGDPKALAFVNRRKHGNIQQLVLLMNSVVWNSADELGSIGYTQPVREMTHVLQQKAG